MAETMKFNSERIEQLSTESKKCSEQLKTLWEELKDKSIAVIDQSWVGKDAAAYTTKVLEKENAVMSVCQALELLGDTYLKVLQSIENAEKTAVEAIEKVTGGGTTTTPTGGTGGGNPPAKKPPTTQPPTTTQPPKSTFTPTTTLPDGSLKPGVAKQQQSPTGPVSQYTDAHTGTPSQPATTKPPVVKPSQATQAPAKTITNPAYAPKTPVREVQ